LGECPQLESINLEGAALSDDGMENIRKVKSLRNLNLTQTPVGSNTVFSVAELSLTQLHLARTRVGSNAVKPVLKMNQLRFLDVRGTGLGDSASTIQKTLPDCVIMTMNPKEPPKQTTPSPRLPAE
jgi:hypothetical protein